MFEADQDIVCELRRLARSGANLNELIAHLQQAAEIGADSRLIVFFYLKAAFLLDLADVLPLGAHSAFNEPGCSDSTIAEIQRKIQDNQVSWDG